MNEWIKELKPGDKVIVSTAWHTSITNVDKITPTGLIKVGGILFHQNGSERGGGLWDSACLMEATPQAIERLEHGKIISKAINLMRNTPKITYEQAVAIIGTLEPKQTE